MPNCANFPKGQLHDNPQEIINLVLSFLDAKICFHFHYFKVAMLLQAKRIYEKTACYYVYMVGDKLINMFAISFVQWQLNANMQNTGAGTQKHTCYSEMWFWEIKRYLSLIKGVQFNCTGILFKIG